MLKHGRQHGKLNNKGLTLVEVIVSITILALVSGIILSSFVASMKASTKSRNLHRATTVAQNIMESINLKTADVIAYQFDYPFVLDASSNEVNNFTIYPQTKFQYAVKDSVGELYETVDAHGDPVFAKVDQSRSLAAYKTLCADPAADPFDILATKSTYMSDLKVHSYEFLPDQDRRYVYYMRNIENDGLYFDAKIILDASNYISTGSSGITANEDLLISVPTIDSTYDAVEVMGAGYDDYARAQLEIDEGETVEVDELHRIIEINIDDALMPGGLHRTQVMVNYKYSFEREGGSISGVWPIKDSIPFDNEGNEDIKQLRNIYLYYYPLYKDGSNTDTIVVNNPDNIDVELYIIKQESPTMTDAQIRVAENNYKVTFNVVESTDNAYGNSHVTLHTNLNENLYAIYSDLPMSSIEQVIWNRNNLVTTKEKFQTTDIKNKKSSDRMYDVTVEVYSSEEYDTANDFKNEDPANYFKEDNYLFTFRSSLSQ